MFLNADSIIKRTLQFPYNLFNHFEEFPFA